MRDKDLCSFGNIRGEIKAQSFPVYFSFKFAYKLEHWCILLRRILPGSDHKSSSELEPLPRLDEDILKVVTTINTLGSSMTPSYLDGIRIIIVESFV